MSKWATNNPCSERLQKGFICLEENDENFCSNLFEDYKNCMKNKYYKLKKIERRLNMNKSPFTCGYSVFTWQKK
jgi:hypothetical protein